MLFETLNQPKVFLALACAGFLAGFFFDASNYITWLFNKSKIVQTVTDFFATVMSFAVFFLTVLFLDYGKVRLYHITIFVLMFFLQRITLGKLIAKFLNWCYNQFTKSMQKLLKRLQKKKKNGKLKHKPEQTV